LPVEFTAHDNQTFSYIINNKLTMASPSRLVATIAACKYALTLEGDFVECGVWRGGNSIAARLIFDEARSGKLVWLFDTFAGMTAPTAEDTTSFSEKPAAETFRERQADDHNEWCYASLEDVQRNFPTSLERVRFVKGDVIETLKGELPEKIAVLRLDTDFYESTKAELEALYPRLVKGGVLIIDDYGHWDGARRAVDEYFANVPRPFFHASDYTGRIGVKV
jgi:hypothetical protein